MKHLLLMVAGLCMAFAGQAQGLALANYRLAGYSGYTAAADSVYNTGRTKCRATRIGSILMIAGGGAAVIGGAALLSPWAKDNDPDHNGGGYKAATAITIAGISVGLVGVIIHIIGQEKDDRGHKHIKVMHDRIGMAWNF